MPHNDVTPADAALLREIADEFAVGIGPAEHCPDCHRSHLWAARLRALADAMEKLTERLTWMAHFADDPAAMANALTLHYDLTGEAKQLLALLHPPGAP